MIPTGGRGRRRKGIPHVHSAQPSHFHGLLDDRNLYPFVSRFSRLRSGASTVSCVRYPFFHSTFARPPRSVSVPVFSQTRRFSQRRKRFRTRRENFSHMQRWRDKCRRKRTELVHPTVSFDAMKTIGGTTEVARSAMDCSPCFTSARKLGEASMFRVRGIGCNLTRKEPFDWE